MTRAGTSWQRRPASASRPSQRLAGDSFRWARRSISSSLRRRGAGRLGCGSAACEVGWQITIFALGGTSSVAAAAAMHAVGQRYGPGVHLVDGGGKLLASRHAWSVGAWCISISRRRAMLRISSGSARCAATDEMQCASVRRDRERVCCASHSAPCRNRGSCT